MLTMTIASHHQSYLLNYNLLHCSSEEYCDYSIRACRSFKQVFKGASWGPFQAGAGGKMPHVGGPSH